MNQPYARVNAFYATLRVRCLECNDTKIMHACYFCVFWVSSIQIGCSMRVVYAECMNSGYDRTYMYLEIDKSIMMKTNAISKLI